MLKNLTIILLFGLMLIKPLYAKNLKLNNATYQALAGNLAIKAHYPQVAGRKLSSAAQQFNQHMRNFIMNEVKEFKLNTKDVNASIPGQTNTRNTLEIKYQQTLVTAGNDSIISILFTTYTNYAGTAHPNFEHTTFNYDLTRGQWLTLRNLLSTSGYLGAFKEIAVKHLVKTKSFKVDEIKDYINFTHWNFDRQGLMFTFDNFPHVFGPQKALIAYTDIAKFAAADSIINRCNQHQCHFN